MKRIGFVTCVDLGLSCLQALVDRRVPIELVVSLKDHVAQRKSGRVFPGNFCQQNQIHLYQAEHINDADCVAVIKAAKLDYLFIIGWSQIASTEVLQSAKISCLGMHPTLLPEGRGRAPIPWAILKGLEQTGVSLFELNERADHGAILAQKIVPMGPQINATQLYELMQQAHADLLVESLPKLMAGTLRAVAQDESKASYWPARKPEDGEIDLAGSVQTAERLVRAVTRPYPGAFARIDNKTIRVWSARICADLIPDRSLTFADGYLELLEFDVF